MTKAEITEIIAQELNKESEEVLPILEEFFKVVKDTLEDGENIYVRGFGSFITKKRAKKLARNIKKGESVTIDAHYIPFFKPAKVFTAMVKESKHFKKVLEEEEQKEIALTQKTDNEGNATSSTEENPAKETNT